MRVQGLRRAVPPLVPVGSVLALLLVLPLAMQSIVVAVLLVGMLGLAFLVLALGMDRASILLMVLSFGLAPADRLNLPGLSFLGISDAIFFLAIGLAFPRLLRSPITLPGIFVGGSLAFVTICLLSSVAANDPLVYYYTARVVYTLIILPVLVVWWAPRGRVLVALLLAYAIGTGISTVYGIPAIGAYRNFGLTQHPNVLGYTTILTLSLVPFLFLALPREWRYWVCGGIIAVCGVGVITSGSRAALVVALFLVVMVPAVERSIPLALAVATAGVVAVGVIGQRAAPTQGQDALSRLLGAGDVSGSDQARTEGVRKTWAVALDHPWLGTGFNFVDFVGHNVYVQVAAAIGFLGLGAFVVVLLSMVTPILATASRHSRLVYPAVVFIVAGPVSPQLTDRYIGLLLGIAVLGVIRVRAELRQPAEDEPAEVEASPALARLNR